MELLVCGEEVSAAGGLVLPILDHEQPPEHTQLVCFITALVSAARSKKVSFEAWISQCMHACTCIYVGLIPRPLYSGNEWCLESRLVYMYIGIVYICVCVCRCLYVVLMC